MSVLPAITSARILTDYDVVLLDAYGVLVDDQGPLPGAVAFIEALQRLHKPFLILTNSASRLPERAAARLQGLGFPLEVAHILTSGMLVQGFYAVHGLQGVPSVVLGTQDSLRYVEQAGGDVILIEAAEDAEVLVIADQAGFDCLEAMNRVMSLVLRRFDRGEPMHLLLCNPDLIYPVTTGQFGFTAGALAAMLEALLRERYPERDADFFVRLGKPHAPIFVEALRRTGGGSRAVMIGDQPATDILGAQWAGIDSVWVRTGLGAGSSLKAGIRPTWQMADLR